jgi:O-phospho-L-seryl-tRNASec:L-selenocysteinyl-tRNA synthase
LLIFVCISLIFFYIFSFSPPLSLRFHLYLISICTYYLFSAVVQSTDKNFLVPVGGAIIASPDPQVISDIAKLYPGRASASPIIDLFITLLSMGEEGLTHLWQERLRVLPVLMGKMTGFARAKGESIIPSPRNSISIGMTVESLTRVNDSSTSSSSSSGGGSGGGSGSSSGGGVSFLGSMLFQRSVSGCRVVPKSSKPTEISGIEFISWGAHKTDYPVSYITAACAIGVTEDEIDEFLARLESVWVKYTQKSKRSGNSDSNSAEPAKPVSDPGV